MSDSAQLSIKYRPATFSETVGQDQAKSTLATIAKADGITARSMLLQGSYGCGKCVSYNTEIVTNKGLRKIGDLFPKGLQPDTSLPVEDLSVFVHGKYEKVSHLYYSGVKPSIKITTSTGSSIEGSHHHPMKRWNGNTCSFDWVVLSDLQEGDLLCTDLTPVPFSALDLSPTRVSLPPSYAPPVGGRPKKEDGFVPTSVDTDFGYFLGLMGVFGQTSTNKTVPSVILSSYFDVQLSYLQGVMDSDGSVSKTGVVELSMCSESIVSFVMNFVNILGLKTRLSRRTLSTGSTSFSLSIESNNRNIFQLFRLQRKIDLLRVTSSPAQSKYSLKYTGLEVMLKKEIELKRQEGSMPRLSETKLTNLIHNSANHGVSEVAWHSEGIKDSLLSLGLLSSVDIPSGSGLVRVDSILHSETELFDLTVPSVHCYRANGLVAHNTTLARIFGKAINCSQFKKTGDVCNECQSCKEVDAEVSSYYKEFDATLVGSVDGVKQLVSSLILSAPAKGFRRAVVIDEVHASSTAAQTALLKVLEEGVPNTFFIFCTTHNVIPTITSRSTLIPFSTIPHDLLYGLVSSLASREGVELPESVAHLVVAKSQGHARNAVSILDSYLRIGQDAVASSYYDFSKLVELVMTKGDEALVRHHLNKIMSYSLVDINFVISEFLRRCFLRQGVLESKIGNQGFTSKFLSYFYQPYVQTALKDERGAELVLLDFISMFK